MKNVGEALINLLKALAIGMVGAAVVIYFLLHMHGCAEKPVPPEPSVQESPPPVVAPYGAVYRHFPGHDRGEQRPTVRSRGMAPVQR